MSVEKDFQEARQIIESLKITPSNEDLLTLYGLYKQAMFGDNSEEAPEGFDFKGIAKHKAWMANKGKSALDAMHDYIHLAHSFAEKYGN